MADVRFTQAANAYKDALRAAERIIAKTTGDAQAAEQPSGTSFMEMVGTALKSAETMGYQNEEMANRALVGNVNLSDVITAVSNAENALQTVVAVRDKVIGAYQEIIRMPI